jgi:predicted ester cyclase
MMSRSVEEIVCEEDKVAVRYRLECVQARTIQGVQTTGRSMTTNGTKIHHVPRGKIVQIAGHDDTLGVLRQLGIADFAAS